MKSKSGNAIDKLDKFLKDVEVHGKQNGTTNGKAQFVSRIPQSKSMHARQTGLNSSDLLQPNGNLSSPEVEM